MMLIRQKWNWLLYFAAGGTLATYLPGTRLTLLIAREFRAFIHIYPPWMHFPLIAFLCVLLFDRALHVHKRYRRNLSSSNPPFTTIEGLAAFVAGVVFAT